MLIMWEIRIDNFNCLENNDKIIVGQMHKFKSEWSHILIL